MKLNPLLRLVITQPQLLVEHAKAYVALAVDEVSRLVSSYKKLALFGIAALFFGVLSVALSGVGFMLWAVLAANNMNVPLALIAVPLLPAVLAGICVWQISRHKISPFSDLKNQISEDVALFKEGGSV